MSIDLSRLREWHKYGCKCLCKDHLNSVRALLDIAEAAQGFIDGKEDNSRLLTALKALKAVNLARN